MWAEVQGPLRVPTRLVPTASEPASAGRSFAPRALSPTRSTVGKDMAPKMVEDAKEPLVAKSGDALGIAACSSWFWLFHKRDQAPAL